MLQLYIDKYEKSRHYQKIQVQAFTINEQKQMFYIFSVRLATRCSLLIDKNNTYTYCITVIKEILI